MKRLNAKTIKALELDKILQILSVATSCDGSRELALNITPYDDLYEIEQDLALTYNAYELTARFGSPKISRIKNIKSSVIRAQSGGVLTLKELLQIASILKNARVISKWAEQCYSEISDLSPIFNEIYVNRKLEELISFSILSEEEIADTASTELATIRRKIKNCELKIKEQLDGMIRSQSFSKFLQDTIVTIRDGRYVVPVKSEYRAEVSGLVHDTSSSGATLFVEPMSVVNANNEIKVLESKERDEIERIIKNISSEVALYADALSTTYDSIVKIDLYFSKARLAFKMRACKPQISNNGQTVLKKARHPLIDPSKVVPIDVTIGVEYNALIITGPNTGGKTVTLKTLGLLTLMTMCGMMIPVSDGSTVSIFNKILVDIGDEQSIEQSLSTFSGHIKNVIDIIDNADNNSLVLLDELGAGTDPTEGAALAISIIQKLFAKGAKIAATTHYQDVKAFALTTNGVENASCEFDVKTLRPTYRLLIGIPGKSNAFEISRKIGLSDEIIQNAEMYISSDNSKLEDVIVKLNDMRQQLELEREAAQKTKLEAEKLLKEAQSELDSAQRRKIDVIEEAHKTAQNILIDVKNRSNALINELESIKSQKDAAEFSKMTTDAKQQLRAKIDGIEKIADPVSKRENSGYRLPRKLIPGDEVILVDIDKRGNVIDIDNKSGRILVKVGIMKINTTLDNLKLIEEKSTKPAFKALRNTNGDREIRSGAKAEIDLRGMMSAEAIIELDRYIDKSVLSNLESITVIHGKGTGALKKAVWQHLKGHPNVKTYRIGTFGEGDLGVTVVTLK